MSPGGGEGAFISLRRKIGWDSLPRGSGCGLSPGPIVFGTGFACGGDGGPTSTGTEPMVLLAFGRIGVSGK